MNADLLTPANITFAFGILAIIFGVYRYFKTPQIDTEKKDALLAQQVQWSKEITEKRFEDLDKRLGESLAISQNHIHTIDIKVDGIGLTVSQLGKELVRLSTIIEERIPAKK
jgi:hypothetical protein